MGYNTIMGDLGGWEFRLEGGFYVAVEAAGGVVLSKDGGGGGNLQGAVNSVVKGL